MVRCQQFGLKQCLFMLCLLTACSKEETAQTVAPEIEVPVVQVQRQDVPVEIEFIGQTKGAVDADVRARVEGVITSIHFEEGKEVTEGMLLYTIDPAPFEAKVVEAKGKLAEAETRLVKAEADLKRVRPLADMNAVSKKDLDTAIAAEGVARASVDAAKSVVESAEIELGYTKIQAPVTGLIGLTKAQVGEFVGRPPNAVVLNTVSQLDPIHVRFPVNEKDYMYFARLKEKAMVEGTPSPKRALQLILADGEPYSHVGEVYSIDSQVDPKSGTITAEAVFPNPGKLIRPGQFAKVRTQKDVISNALIVPKRAIEELQGQARIYVVKPDNTVEQKPVVRQAEVKDGIVVTGDISDSDRIVLEGQQRLRNGMMVKPKLQSAVL